MSTSKVDYIDIDSLLDMRLGAVGLIDETFAADLISTPAYYERCFDSFSFGNDPLDTEKLKKVLGAFRANISRNALPTAIVQHLCAIVNQREFVSKTQPNIEFADIHISVKGCGFTEEEKLAFAQSVKQFVPNTNVICVDYSIEDIAFDVIKENYFTVTVYDLTKAMLPFDPLFAKGDRLRKTVVYAPRIFNTRAGEKEHAMLMEYKEDPFYLEEGILAEFYFRASFLPMSLYCAMTPFNPSIAEQKKSA